MRQEDNHKLLAAECALSLAEAIQKAGGGIDAKGMLGITLGEFIACVAAQNHIRFVYDDPRKPSDSDSDSDSDKDEDEPRVRVKRSRLRHRKRRPAREEEEEDDIEDLLDALDSDDDF